jgi:RimJ/RimL family protein N-acetyltransferase
MTSFPVLHTARLILRKLQPEDFDALVRHANNRKISDQILNIPHPYGEPQAAMRLAHVVQGFKAGSHYAFALFLREREALIGEASLNMRAPGTAEMGYWIGEPFWGAGYASEAVGGLLSFGFEMLGLKQIYATCYEDNPASQKVLQKNGLMQAGADGRVLRFAVERSA